MCSLMEKDVLLEEVSAMAAFIFRRMPIGEEKPEFLRCSESSAFLYSQAPEYIDAKAIRSELHLIKQKFKDLPKVY